MIAMIAIYAAGLVSGILLVVIALAGWIRSAGKKLGGEDNQTPAGVYRLGGNTDAGAVSLAGDGAHRHRRRYRSTSSAA